MSARIKHIYNTELILLGTEKKRISDRTRVLIPQGLAAG